MRDYEDAPLQRTAPFGAEQLLGTLRARDKMNLIRELQGEFEIWEILGIC